MPEETAMTQELTTRDIFQQLNTRLTRVEDDLRAFHAEVISRFDKMSDRIDQMSDQTNDRFEQTNARFNDRFDQINTRFDQWQWRVVSLFVITWVTVIGSIWLKP